VPSILAPDVDLVAADPVHGADTAVVASVEAVKAYEIGPGADTVVAASVEAVEA
jgi:hypothetical protein